MHGGGRDAPTPWSPKGTHRPEMMAGALVSIVPMVLLFVVAQQYFVRGIAISGLKG